MDKKAAIRAYAIVIMLMISVSGAALAPFLATLNYQQQTSIDDQAPQEAVVTCHNGGSYFEVSKTASAWWTEVKTYDWTVLKSVDPTTATLDPAATEIFDYTITATRTVDTDVNKFGVSGTIRVWNDGNQATVGLSITDTIKYQLEAEGTWYTLQTSNVDVSSKPIIPAYTSGNDNDVGFYSYNIEFTPVNGAIAYKNVATATATNMLSCTNTGSKTFSLPTSPALTEVDESATLTDGLTVPAHYSIVGSVPPVSYPLLTGSAVKTYSVTIQNDDAPAESVSSMTNTAMVTECDSGEYDESTATVVLTAGGVLEQPETEMTIVKTGPSEALPGETISWHILLTNTGDVQLNNIQVTDTLTDDPFLGVASLAPGASTFWDVDYTIPLSTTAKVVTNTATASVDVGADDLYIVAASAIVTILYPGFEVSKTANVEYAVPGETITYTVRVTNMGNVDLVGLVVVDSMKGNLVFPDVPVDQFKEVTYTYLVSSNWDLIPVNEDDELCNEVSVTASGESEGGFPWEITHSADECLFVPMPSIDIVKTAKQEFVCVGDSIVYSITVTNDGNTVLYNVHVVDVIAGIDVTIPELAVDASMTYPGFFDVEDDVGDEVVNTATAVGFVDGFREWTVDDEASVTVPVAKPDIEVTKVGSSATAVPGDIITYTVSVKNIGNWDLEDVDMTDTLKGVIDSDVDIVEGATWSTTYTYTVPDDQTLIVNTFSATYDVCEPVTKSATWTVKVTLEEDTPMIWIEKNGPCRAEPGELVPFWITVTNTGNVPISDVYVWDLTNGEYYYLDEMDDDLEGFVGDGTLLPDQVWELPTINAYVFDNTELDVYVNIAQVFGMYGELNVWCQDSHAVDLIHPAISVVKSGPEMSAEGHDITYTITVTNIGDVSLYNVVLYDTVRGSMEPCGGDDQGTPKTVVPYDEILIGYLGLGASKTVSYTFSVPGEYAYDYVCNEVVAWGQPGPSSLWCGHGACAWFDETNEGRWVSDRDCACTFIAKPGISVDKTGPPCVDPKIGDMTFTVTVENTGNIMIKDLYIWDNATGNYYAFKEDANLAVDEIREYEIEYNLGEWSEDDGDWFENVVEVRGDVFGDGHANVWDDGTWSVHVNMPQIRLTKQVSNVDGAMPGDVITFTFFIENIGNMPLTDIVLYDAQIGGPDFPMDIIDLGIGDSTTVEYLYTIPLDVSGDLSNFAKVIGFGDCDECPIEVSSESEVLFFIADPEISVLKAAEIGTLLVGETVHWQITVWNSGNIGLTDVYLDDSLAALGTFDYGEWDFTLAVGETVVVDFYFLVTEGSWDADDMVCNEVVAYGYYNDFEVADYAEDCVFIAQPSMTVEKTGPEEVCYGSEIEWTVTVTNTGNVVLYDVQVVDALTGDLWVIEELGLEASEEFNPTFDTSSTVLTDPVKNKVDVTADVFGDESNFIYGSASHEVKVAFVDIEVEKSGPEYAVRGETITYVITVYNNGNRDVVAYLNDAMVGLVDYDVFIAAGDSWSEEFTYDISECYAYECLDNTVTVDAEYKCCSDSDEASWCVEIREIGIKVLKTGPENAVPGEWIQFRFDVWNSGEVTLSDIVANDVTLGVLFPIEGVLVPEGGLGANHAVWIYDYQIPSDYLGESPCGWLDNHVIVKGYFHGVETHWADGWSVWVHQPDCIELPQY